MRGLKIRTRSLHIWKLLHFFDSLEMEEERHYNELTGYGHGVGSLGVSIGGSTPVNRSRTTSSPVPTNRPLSPSLLSYSRDGLASAGTSSLMGTGRDPFSPPSPMGRCPTCAQTVSAPSSSPPHAVRI